MNRDVMQAVYQDLICDSCDALLELVGEEGVGPLEATGVMLPVLAAVSGKMALALGMSKDDYLGAFGRVFDIVSADAAATRQ